MLNVVTLFIKIILRELDFTKKKKKRCEELIHVKKLRQQNFIMLFWSKVFNSAVSVNCDYKIDLF